MNHPAFDRDSGFTPIFLAASLAGALVFAPGADRASAQTTVSPNVIVDESVLEELGPRPNLPGMIRREESGYQAPPRFRRPYPAPRTGYAPAAPGAPGRLLPAPNRMLRSRVTAPRPPMPPTRLVRPTRPTVKRPPPPKQVLGKGPGVLGQVKQSEVDNLGRKRRPPPTPPKVSVPTAPPSPVVPALPKTAKPSAPPPPKVAAPVAPPKAVPQAPAPPPPAPPKVAATPPVAPPAAPKVVAPPPPAPPKVAAPKVAVPPPSGSPKVAVPAPPPVTPPAAKSAKVAPPRITPPPSAKPAKPPQVASLPAGTPPAVAGSDGQKVTVHFAPKATDIPPGAAPFLADLVRKMKSDKSLRLQLKGYAGSAKGSASQARRMSLFRALSVRTHLMKRGIRSTRMDVRALGNKVKGGKPDRVDIEVKK